MMTRGGAGSSYSWQEKMLSSVINLLFYLNLNTEFEANQVFFIVHMLNSRQLHEGTNLQPNLQ
jgi:hypothetical protein